MSELPPARNDEYLRFTNQLLRTERDAARRELEALATKYDAVCTSRDVLRARCRSLASAGELAAGIANDHKAKVDEQADIIAGLMDQIDQLEAALS